MPTARRNFIRTGFTLIELLVVIAIIVLALSLAVPTINVLEGNRSLETAQNNISSYLAIARNDAMYNRQTMGVCFYVDPASQQTAMVEVAPIPSADFSGDSAWTTANTTATAIDVAGTFTSTPSLTPYRDVQLLPKGVAIALYNAPVTNPAPTYNIDHLVRMGIIMFDQYGMLTTLQYGIPLNDQTNLANTLASAPALTLTQDLNPTTAPLLYSSPGFVIYDHQQYLSGGASFSPVLTFTDADFQYQPPGQSSPTTPATLKTYEEYWIAGNFNATTPTLGNGISLMVNQFNGTLVKGK